MNRVFSSAAVLVFTVAASATTIRIDPPSSVGAHKPAMYREHTTVEHTGAIDIVARLDAGRARVAKLDK